MSGEYKEQKQQLSLQVLQTKGPTLLGRDRLHELVLDWGQLNIVRQHADQGLQSLLEEYAEVKEDLGAVCEVKVQIHVKPHAQPRYC